MLNSLFAKCKSVSGVCCLLCLILGLGYSSIAEAVVCFLPDVENCVGANTLAATRETERATEDCSQYSSYPYSGASKLSSPAECTKCDGTWYCQCPGALSLSGNVCKCQGNTYKSGNDCLACLSPKQVNSDNTTCTCPASTYTSTTPKANATCNDYCQDGSTKYYNLNSCTCNDSDGYENYNGNCVKKCRTDLGQTRNSSGNCICTRQNEKQTPKADGTCECNSGYERNTLTGLCEVISTPPEPARYFYVTTEGYDWVMPKIISGAEVVSAEGYDIQNDWNTVINYNGDLDDNTVYVHMRKYKVLENADLVIDRGYCSSVLEADGKTYVTTAFEGTGNCNFKNIIENATEPLITLKASDENLAGCTVTNQNSGWYGTKPWGHDFAYDKGAFMLDDASVVAKSEFEDIAWDYFPTNGGCLYYDLDRTSCIYDSDMQCWRASKCLDGETTTQQTCQEGYRLKSTQRGSDTCYACLNDTCSGTSQKSCNGGCTRSAGSTAYGTPCYYCNVPCQLTIVAGVFSTPSNYEVYREVKVYKYKNGSRSVISSYRCASTYWNCSGSNEVTIDADDDATYSAEYVVEDDNINDNSWGAGHLEDSDVKFYCFCSNSGDSYEENISLDSYGRSTGECYFDPKAGSWDRCVAVLRRDGTF